MFHEFPQPICKTIWAAKYQFKTQRNEYPPDFTVEDTWERIANACARVNPEESDQDRQATADRFYNLLSDFKFSPAGRILAGAGTGRDVTLFNCFVMGTIPDSLSGIFDMLKEAALTMQQGGGIGYDFSPIRPSTSFVRGVEAESSGPLSFMDVWDSMCRTIMSAGGRRGAMMATMRCDHPDVMDFIAAKREVGRMNQFNMSVLVTDELMNKVKTGDDIALVHSQPPMGGCVHGQDENGNYIYGYVNAEELWDSIMEETYHHAEPGVIFIDRINKENNLWFAETIMATNPCGEQPLPPYGACLLGSINVTKFVIDPFTPNARLDTVGITEAMMVAVELIDSVIDISNFPLEAQREEALLKRRMGIGVTGLADAMFMLGVRYGSNFSKLTTETVLRVMANAGYKQSALLAKEYGPAPILESEAARKKMVTQGWARNLSKDVIALGMKYGFRNTHIMSIAPTGTMSLYMGNVSSGIEPNFAYSYVRKVLQKDHTKIDETVYASAALIYEELLAQEPEGTDEHNRLVEWKESFWCTAQDLKPEDHVAVQAAAQKWVDSSISKTVNLPKDISMEDFKSVYIDAFQQGCKGCTTYRPNDILGSVLSVEEPEETNEDPEEVHVPLTPTPVILDRPTELDGKTYKLRWNGSAVYVTFNFVMLPEGGVPFEMFIVTKNPEHQAWMGALTRMISAVFRRGGDVSFVVEELKAVHDPKGGAWVDGKYVPSLVALLGQTLEHHMNWLQIPDATPPSEQPLEEAPLAFTGTPNQCPSCGEYAMVEGAGCATCSSCGYSKCG